MANTYSLIEAKTLTTTTASITFSSIPASYTDLQLVCSLRSNFADGNTNGLISFNGSTANFTNKYLAGTGSIKDTGSSGRYLGEINANTGTASTFSNISIYIPNYTSSNNKSFSSDGVQENNQTLAYVTFAAGLWSDSAAITSITLSPGGGSLVQYSTAYLYGIKKN